jgi:transposase
VVLGVDEKSRIQALDRTQPGLPMKKGRGATITHDYRRHGTTTLFAAALDVLDGTVFGRNRQRDRHQEFIRFLNALEREIPAGKVVHAILDNSAAHKAPEARRWLARHPRWTFHFTPTSSSWLDAVEGFFAKLSRRRLERGVSARSWSCRRPSTVSSRSTTPVPSHSCGGPIPTRSSPRVPEGSKRWSRCVRIEGVRSAAASIVGSECRRFIQGPAIFWKVTPERRLRSA